MMSIHQIRKLQVIIGLLLLVGIAAAIQAQVPQTINFQGYLTNATGAPLTGTYSMTFKFYTVATGGTAVWTETQTVTVTNGVYNVRLGSVTPITLATPTQYYLGVAVGADAEMTPRTTLSSVMSALMLRDVMLNGSNTFVGINAGVANTTGVNNTFVGQAAGHANTSGSANTFVGMAAGNANTTAFQNTFVGYAAGQANTTGVNNTFLGMAAGAANTTGGYNTFVGQAAGQANTTGAENTFVGNEAGNANTTGDANTFVGRGAGRNNTTGALNTFVGRDAGLANTTGTANTFVGYAAGDANATGDDNTFVGRDAGLANTTGHANTFVGMSAGRGNTTGNDNTFLGYLAGNSNTTGNANTFVGETAGNATTTGADNTFLGVEAGRYNTTGFWNTFVGYASGVSNTTGHANTFLGDLAGYTNITGVRNVFVGYGAGYAETGSDRLYIANSDTTTPLIYGEFNNNRLRINGNLEVTGTAAKPGGGTWSTLSDQRLKDVQGQFTRGLEALNQLQPVAYRYKAGNPLNLPSDATYIGLSAQEVQHGIPEAVSAGWDGYLTLNSDPILWTMLNAIKQLQAENQTLRQELEALKARINP